MNLYFYGHENVSQPSYPRVESAEGLLNNITQMETFMIRQGLSSLAAPQVGILKQLVIVKWDKLFLPLVNPVIKGMYGSEYELVETCSSCPPRDNCCKVARIQIIEVWHSSIQQLDLTEKSRFKGDIARMIQHEIDHLEGTFFFHRASNREKHGVLQRFEQWQKRWKLTHERKQYVDDSGSASTPKGSKAHSSPV